MPARLVKICKGPCGRELPLEWFVKNSNYADGRTARCKDCINAQRRMRSGAKNRSYKQADGTWRCSQCGHCKHIECFPKRDVKQGSRFVCDQCLPTYSKNIWYKHTYGITYKEFEIIFANQNHTCASCRQIPDTPCLDHDHDTGRVRGILCHHCNVALGLLKNDPIRIQQLLMYRGDHLAR